MTESTPDLPDAQQKESPLPKKQPPAQAIHPTLLGLLQHQMHCGSDCRNIYGINEEHKWGDRSKFVETAVSGTFDNLAPKDEIEAMLIGQIVVTHNVAMECYKQSIKSGYGNGGYYHGGGEVELANKCTRSCAMLVETLNRYRGKGQQKVVVEHVHVYQGGQAIVGNVSPRGRGGAKKSEKPHAP